VTTCGVSLAPKGLVAVLVDGAGRARSCTVAVTDEARWGLALWLAAAGVDLVIDEALPAADPIAHIACRAGVTIWIAGPPLLPALRHAAGIARRGPRPAATLLARLPGIPWLRQQLRRFNEPDTPPQVNLL